MCPEHKVTSAEKERISPGALQVLHPEAKSLGEAHNFKPSVIQPTATRIQTA